MKTITSLTPVQIARFPEWREKWIKNGLSCEPVDPQRVRRAVWSLYRRCNLKHKPTVIISPSPIVTCMTGAVVACMRGLELSVRATLRQVGKLGREATAAGYDGSLWERVHRLTTQLIYQMQCDKKPLPPDVDTEFPVSDDVNTYYVDRLMPTRTEEREFEKATRPLSQTVLHQPDISDLVDNSTSEVALEAQDDLLSAAYEDPGNRVFCSFIRNNWHNYRGGNLWSSWCAYISFLRDVCGWRHPSLYAYRAEELLVQSAGWYYPAEDFCIVTERPKEIHLDDQNRLHCENGMCIDWSDGWGLWMIHGYRVDEQVVMRPKTQKIDQITEEENEEVKRIRIERYGWQRYLDAVGAKVVDERRNDIENTLESLMATNDQRVLVCACPSTGRVYSLEVPPEIKTCESAQAWLWGDTGIRIIGRT